ncbi:MAG: hypothetical protein LBT04_06590 [Prevotellaceae bacterium]|jgi:hypothetical protein|nr:hypothetical protein [Prevotellaceae bacterium]
MLQTHCSEIGKFYNDFIHRAGWQIDGGLQLLGAIRMDSRLQRFPKRSNPDLTGIFSTNGSAFFCFCEYSMLCLSMQSCLKSAFSTQMMQIFIVFIINKQV